MQNRKNRKIKTKEWQCNQTIYQEVTNMQITKENGYAKILSCILSSEIPSRYARKSRKTVTINNRSRLNVSAAPHIRKGVSVK